MATYILSRLGNALTTLILAFVVIFAGVRMLPGDAALAIYSQDTSGNANLEQIRHQLGLDRPWIVQFWSYVTGILHGDWGRSISTGQPVTTTIAQTLPVTLELAVLALIFATVLGVLLGVLAAVRQGTKAEWAANGGALFFMSIPSFWLGMILILVFAVKLHLLPASGYVSPWDDLGMNLVYMIMPVFVLGTGLAAITMRQMRVAMVENMNSDFIRTARARGFSERKVIWRYAARNSMLSVVTLVSLQLGFLLSGAVITEQVFVIPGFGKLMIAAITGRDYAVVQGVVLVVAFLYVLVNFLADLLYTWIDPRVRSLQGSRR